MKLVEVYVNGKDTVLDAGCETVGDLLSVSPWSGKRVLVELNGTAVRKEEYGYTRLSPGDRIELVHFVGGG